MILKRLLHTQNRVVFRTLDIHLDGGHGFPVQNMINGIDIQDGRAIFTGKAVLGIIQFKADLASFLIDADVDAPNAGKILRVFHQHIIVFATCFDRNDFLISVSCIFYEASQGITVICSQIEKDIIAIPQDRDRILGRKILVFLFHSNEALQITADAIIYQSLQYLTRSFICQ